MIERGSNADDTAKSQKHKSKKRGRDDDTKTSVSMSVPENASIVLKGSISIAGNVIVQNGRERMKIASAIRKEYRMAKRSKQYRKETEEEKQEREREQEESRRKENQKRWATRERDRGLQLTEEEHKQLDREEKASMARKGKAAIDPETKMAPLTAFFAPKEREEEEANSQVFEDETIFKLNK
eukprot:jgi/Picsp_1/201/NSC_00200-R1_---NA---